MDTVLNIGLNDETGTGHDQADRITTALYTTPTAAWFRCLARSSGIRDEAFEEVLDEFKKAATRRSIPT